MVEMSLLELAGITGQYGIVTRSRSPVAGFKIRENSPVGLIVTLRGERIYAFYDRLVNLAFPRIRDFQGVIVVLMVMEIIILVWKNNLYFLKFLMNKLIYFGE